MPRRSADRRSHAAAPGGFTLIEMLVATTLVVMMMLLFAQIYTAAIRSLNDQQALARNDQRMRALDQVLRSDLLRGSFRQIPGSRGIVPLVNGDTIHSTQKGYFYYSENDRTNPLDDVLQFTMLVSPDSREHDQTPFYGRCYGWQYPNTMTNHPDEDDGIPLNNVGMSRGAEVVYFVRAGSLYRRVLLLRDPALGTVQNSNQPVTAAGAPYLANEVAQVNTTSMIDIQGSYSQRYDYAAYQGQFLGLSALDNYSNSLTTPVASTTAVSLGIPRYRFGFNSINGQPVEFANGGAFFGRMTHAETGHRNCIWPANGNDYLDQSNNPQNVVTPNPIMGGNALTYNSTTTRLSVNGIPLFNNTRVNEDLLMNNVEAFDIEVWDPLDDMFVQLGLGSGFSAAARVNSAWGPNSITPADNWMFDTGHPSIWNHDPAFSSTIAKPAYRPLTYRFSEDSDLDNTFDSPGEDLDGDGTFDDPASSAPYRLPGMAYAAGTVVFRPGDTSLSIAYRCVRTVEDPNGNGVLDGSEDTDGDGNLDLGEDSNNNGQLDYAEVGPALTGLSGSETLINWPQTPGVQFHDGAVTWEAFDNRLGLEMIRITIRTRDTTTGNPRQFSLIHSFVEPPPGK